MESAYLKNYWFYLPSEGVHWSSSGSRYPLFVQEAKGSRVYDTEARAYLDYTCGWGACFLGHAEPRIAQAVADSLHKRALSGLPQDIEIELTDRLCALFPGAEMALFGKNGSDVTTAAVRMAREFCGRPLVLYGGYHGWHDGMTPMTSAPYRLLQAISKISSTSSGVIPDKSQRLFWSPLPG
jgi:glutamate-1-semialdehyde aminotransferase